MLICFRWSTTQCRPSIWAKSPSSTKPLPSTTQRQRCLVATWNIFFHTFSTPHTPSRPERFLADGEAECLQSAGVCDLVYPAVVDRFFYLVFRFYENHMRLSAQLLHTSWQQLELQFESDMMKLKDWASQFNLFAAKQVPFLAIKKWQLFSFGFQILLLHFRALPYQVMRQDWTTSTSTTASHVERPRSRLSWMPSTNFCTSPRCAWGTQWSSKCRVTWELMGFLKKFGNHHHCVKFWEIFKNHDVLEDGHA